MFAPFRRLMLVTVAIALFAWGCGDSEKNQARPSPTPRQGVKQLPDDRPPIIISDGSVNFDIYADPGKGGDWQRVTPGDDTVWYHNISANPVDHFEVTFDSGFKTEASNSTQCQAWNPPFSVLTFKINFNGFLKDVWATVTKESGRFQIKYEGGSDASNDQQDPHRLISAGFLHFRHLKSVELPAPSGSNGPCTFKANGNAQLTVRQVTQ